MRSLRPFVFCISFAALLLASPMPVRGQGATIQSGDPFGQNVQLKTPQPRIDIPGLDFTPIGRQIDKDGGFIYVSSIGEYISAVYRYAVVVASIVAAIVIIIAGFQWTASGGSPDAIGAAKKRIVGAVTGLILAVGSYTILYAINPELVQFRALRIQFVKEETMQTVEGNPETALGGRGVKVIAGNQCTTQKLAVFPGYSPKNTFGRTPGFCLGWVKSALTAACGNITPSLDKLGAWDVAAGFFPANFTPCRLDDKIKDGDLVFMTSMGSNWIGLWENFRLDEKKGCTIADAKPKGKATRFNEETQKDIPTTSVVGEPKGMPPVTHIGVYYQGKVYHFVGKVTASPATQRLIQGAQRPKANWKGVELTGNFIAGNTEFIAGYASW